MVLRSRVARKFMVTAASGALVWAVTPNILFGDSAADGPAADIEAPQINHVFVPVGFDDNDDVTAVIDGFLPSGCHKFAGIAAQFDQARGEIRLEPQVKFENRPCIEARVPFSTVAHLGELDQGDYTVTVPSGGPSSDDLVRDLEVLAAPDSRKDSHDYAPIEEVTFHRKSADRQVTLEGRMTSTCLEWDRVDLNVTGNTIQILPIVKTTNYVDCGDTLVEFEKTVNLPPRLGKGRYLLHVRSLSGQAINKVISLKRPSSSK